MTISPRSEPVGHDRPDARRGGVEAALLRFPEARWAAQTGRHRAPGLPLPADYRAPRDAPARPRHRPASATTPAERLRSARQPAVKLRGRRGAARAALQPVSLAPGRAGRSTSIERVPPRCIGSRRSGSGRAYELFGEYATTALRAAGEVHRAQPRAAHACADAKGRRLSIFVRPPVRGHARGALDSAERSSHLDCRRAASAIAGHAYATRRHAARHSRAAAGAGP